VLIYCSHGHDVT